MCVPPRSPHAGAAPPTEPPRAITKATPVGTSTLHTQRTNCTCAHGCRGIHTVTEPEVQAPGPRAGHVPPATAGDSTERAPHSTHPHPHDSAHGTGAPGTGRAVPRPRACGPRCAADRTTRGAKRVGHAGAATHARASHLVALTAPRTPNPASPTRPPRIPPHSSSTIAIITHRMPCRP